jgi:hypothetical protein
MKLEELTIKRSRLLHRMKKTAERIAQDSALYDAAAAELAVVDKQVAEALADAHKTLAEQPAPPPRPKVGDVSITVPPARLGAQGQAIGS